MKTELIPNSLNKDRKQLAERSSEIDKLINRNNVELQQEEYDISMLTAELKLRTNCIKHKPLIRFTIIVTKKSYLRF